MYGRGACDMKSGTIGALYALDAIRAAGLKPTARIHFQSVIEEESTGVGALSTLQRGYRADAALIPEPEQEMLARANIGVLWFRFEVRGVPAHVREMGTGANAIDAAYRIVAALRGLEAELNAEKVGRRHFEDEPHPLNLNIGKIEGGDWASSVPCWCKVDCRIGLYPGVTAQEIAQRVEDCIRAASRSDSFLANNPPKVTFNGFWAEGYVLEPGSEAEAVLARAHEAAIGKPLRSFMTS